MKTDQKKWFCKQCSLKFNSSSIYSLHLKLVHKNRNVKAAIKNEEEIKESDETENKFAVIPDFGKDKAIVQPGKKTFKCEFCDYSSTKEHLNRHISSVHEGKKPFKVVLLLCHDHSRHKAKNARIWLARGLNAMLK